MNRIHPYITAALFLASLSAGEGLAQNVTLQSSTPGTPQVGHMNITGTGIAGTFAGRHLDKGGQVFNVKGYGAKGDNLTDDTAAIQSAISACQSGGGGVVFLPSGNYRTTGLTVTGQGVVLQGTPQSTLIGASTTQWVLLFDSPGSLAFHNELLTLTIGHANQGQSSSVGAVRLFNQAQFLISDVRVGASAGGGLPNLGIYLENAQSGTVMDSIIGRLGNGVTLYKSGNLTLNNILVANTGGTGFLIDAVGGLWGYALQTYNNSGFGFYVYDSIPNDGYFSENQFYTACAGDTSGLPNWVVASVRRLSLDHCWGASNISKDQNTWASGFYFIGTINGSGYSSVTDVTMTGCWAVQNNKRGIEIADAQNVSVLNCEVLGNSVSGNSQEGIGILGRSSNIRLVGNRCRDDHLVPSTLPEDATSWNRRA